MSFNSGVKGRGTDR